MAGCLHLMDAESGSRPSNSGAGNNNVHLGNLAPDTEGDRGTEGVAEARYQRATEISMA